MILLVASFLRLYRLHTTIEFDIDQANLYHMAYDVVHHGLIPVTSNEANRCVVLLGPVHGLAVFLEGPYDSFIDMLLLNSRSQMFTALNIQAQFRTLPPRVFSLGPFRAPGISFEASSTTTEYPPDPTLSVTILHTSDGKDHVVVPVPG